MARGDAAWLRQVAEFRRELQTALSPAFIGKHMAEHKAKAVIQSVVASASAGIGSGDSRYKDYSPAYAARKKKAGHMRWLRGIKNTGRTGGMLDHSRFRLAVEGGKLWLIWTSTGGAMDIYADLHNQPGNPKLPQREWMHFETALTQRTVHKALEQTLDEIAAKFNLGAPIR